MYVNEFQPKLQTSDTLFSHSKSQHDQAVYPLQFDAVPGHVKGQDMVNLKEIMWHHLVNMVSNHRFFVGRNNF